MAIKAILLAVGTGDAERIGGLAEGTINVTGPTGTTIVVEHVFTKDEYDDALGNLDLGITAEEVSTDDVTQRHTIIRELTHRFDDADIDYVIHGRISRHGEKLVELTGEVDADYLVVGGRKCSPTGKAVFGSIIQEVILEASCPVTFVHADTK